MVEQDEAEFIYYKNGTAGSFKTGLYDLYFKADEVNRAKLMQVFPYLWVCQKYSEESGYYEDLRMRWMNSR